MARSNGGIIGKSNKTSFGKNKITAVNATGCFTSQPGTTAIKTLVIAGGGAGSFDKGGGAGAGGLLNPGADITICSSTGDNAAMERAVRTISRWAGQHRLPVRS